MTKEAIGRASLKADAAYCALAGSAVVGLRGPLARTLGVPPALLAGAGFSTIGWAGLIATLARQG